METPPVAARPAVSPQAVDSATVGLGHTASRLRRGTFVVLAMGGFTLGAVALLTYQAVRWPGPGLRLIGHYARLDPNSPGVLTMGTRAGADFVLLGEDVDVDAGRVALQGGSFRLSAPPEGGLVRVLTTGEATGRGTAPPSDTQVFALPLDPGRYTVAGVSTARTVVVVEVADVVLREEGVTGIEAERSIAVALDGTAVAAAGVRLIGCPSGIVHVLTTSDGVSEGDPCTARPPDVVRLHVGERGRVHRSGRSALTVHWRPPKPADDGLLARAYRFATGWSPLSTMARVFGAAAAEPLAEAIGMRGNVLPLPGLDASLVWRRDVTRRMDPIPDGPVLLVTSPLSTSGLELRPGIQRSLGFWERVGASSGITSPATHIDRMDPLQVGDQGTVQIGANAFVVRVLPESLRGSLLLALLRVQHPAKRRRLFIPSSRDAGLFLPHPLIPVHPCGELDERVRLLSVADPGAVPSPPEGLPVGAVLRTRFPRPAWLSTPERETATVVCVEGGRYHLRPARPNGRLALHVPMVFRSGEMASDRPDDGDTVLAENDAVLIGGQIFVGERASRPTAFLVVQMTAALAIFAGSLPLLIVAFRRFEPDVNAVLAERTALVPWIARLGLACGPLLMTGTIVILMTIGSWYHIRLASSAALVGSMLMVNHFVTSQMAAIAAATMLFAWRTDSRPGSFGGGVQCGLFSLGLSTAVTFWVDPAIMSGLGAWSPAGLRLVGSQPFLHRLLPLAPVLAVAGALLLEWAPAGAQAGVRWTGTVAVRSWRWVAGWADHCIARTDMAVRQFALTRPAGRVWWRLWWRLRFAWWSVLSTLALVLRPVVEVSVLVAPIALLGSVGLRYLPLSLDGKEILGPVIALLCAWMLASFRVQTEGEPLDDVPDPESARPWRVVAAPIVLLVFLWVLHAVPDLANATGLRLVGWLLNAALVGLLLAWPRHYRTAVLVRVFVAYGLVLTTVIFASDDLGSLLVWTPVLVAALVFVLLSSIYFPLAEPSATVVRGHLLAATATIVLPALLLGETIRNYESLLAWVERLLRPLALERTWTRFALVRAPFYHAAGDWLTQVRWLAGQVYRRPDAWVANMNSDVAFYGLHYHYAIGALVMTGGTLLVCLVLACGVVASYWGAFTTRLDVERQPHLVAALFGVVAVTALAMQVLVHLAGAALDKLPLTGIAHPWLSHGGSTSVVFTLLVTFAMAEMRNRVFAARGEAP